MIFVPIGYTFGAGMFEMESIKGGSPYGSGTFAGDGTRQPTELELAQAFHQGKYFAGIAKKLKGSQWFLSSIHKECLCCASHSVSSFYNVQQNKMLIKKERKKYY
jgi:hypothetical protein